MLQRKFFDPLINGIIIFLVLFALVYGPLKQGAFYLPVYSRIQQVVLLAAILGLGKIIWKRQLNSSRTSLDGWIFLWICALGISLLFSTDVSKSIIEMQKFLVYVLLFWLIANYVKSENLVSLTVTTLVGTSVVVGIIGLLAIAWEAYPLAMKEEGLWRTSSTFTYANAAGSYFLLTFPLAFVSYSYASSRWQRLLFGFFSYIILLSLILTHSRSTLLALTVTLPIFLIPAHSRIRNLRSILILFFSTTLGLIFFLSPSFSSVGYLWIRGAVMLIIMPVILAIMLIRLIVLDQDTQVALLTAGESPMPTRFPKRLVSLLVIFSLLLLVYASFHFGLLGVFVKRFSSGGGYVYRMRGWSNTWQMIKMRPIVGSGLGTYSKIYQNLSPNWFLRYAHNEYLQMLAETGIVGFIPFVGLLVAIILSVYKIAFTQRHSTTWPIELGLFASIVGFLLQSSFDFLWHIPALVITFFALLGLIEARRKLL